MATATQSRKNNNKISSTEAEEVLKMLNKIYPHTHYDMNFLKFNNPFEILIMTILSAQTTDKTVNSLHDELFDAYPSPKELAKANPEAIERIIRPAGYYHSKAKNIIATSERLMKEFNGIVPQTIEELTTLPGVGRKTANIVTNHAFHKTFGIAVDTHVKRLSIRIGFTCESDPEKIEQDLTCLFEKKWWEHVNYLLISHGRAVCDAKKPDCEHCIIRTHCRNHD